MPLLERVAGQPHGDEHQGRQRAHKLPQPPGAAALRRLLFPLLGDTGVDEVPG